MVIVYLMLALITSSYSTRRVIAEGLGEKILYSHDTDDSSEFIGQEGADTVFRSGVEGDSGIENEFKHVVEKIRLDLVAPGQSLMKMMNLISTKTRVMFLKEDRHYYKNLGVGSTSRPMLFSYLGLELTSSDELLSWYRPLRDRIGVQLVDSCRSLISVHHSYSQRLDRHELEVIRRMKSQEGNKLHLAYLLFKSNLNLFMLETYLRLCSRLEHERLKENLTGLILDT